MFSFLRLTNPVSPSLALPTTSTLPSSSFLSVGADSGNATREAAFFTAAWENTGATLTEHAVPWLITFFKTAGVAKDPQSQSALFFKIILLAAHKRASSVWVS